jgi:DNA-binding transcriptional LysR family regulator
MELRQLEHFVAVAEEQHFTRAAQRVHIVQSALSASIRSLEEELEARLFVRSTRRVHLTATGRLFLDKARAALAAVGEARDVVRAVESLERGRLTIGTVQSLPAFLDLPALIAGFYALHPGIELRLCQGDSLHLLDKLRDGRLDLAFLPICDVPPGIATMMIACEDLVFICAPDHPLAGRNSVPLDGLAFVDFEPDWGTRRLVDRAFADARLSRRTAFEVSDLETLMEMVALGLGVALVPEPVARARGRRLSVIPLDAGDLCWELVAAYRDTGAAADGPAEPAARRFLDRVLAQSDAESDGASADADPVGAPDIIQHGVANLSASSRHGETAGL